MNRVVEPEVLDELPVADPRAVESRRDLRRINALMGNARIIRRFLQSNIALENLTVAEIGAGDGNISKQIAAAGRNVHVVLVDRQPVAPNVISSDVFDWLQNPAEVDIIVANLFLHHFSDEQLRRMFELIAKKCHSFVACEPRRERLAEWFSKRLNLIGCNAVTQNDALISVRAGFRNRELSALWPSDSPWRLTETRAGLFSHLFGAVRP